MLYIPLERKLNVSVVLGYVEQLHDLRADIVSVFHVYKGLVYTSVVFSDIVDHLKRTT